MKISSLNLFNITAFFKSQILLLPVLFLFYIDNGLTVSDYFLFQGIIVLINVFLQIPIGILGNYISRKKLIIISYLLYLGRVCLWIFGWGYLTVLLGEICYAISKSIFDAVEAPYIYEVLKSKNQEDGMLKSYSNLNFAMCLGIGVASVLGTVLYDKTGIITLLAAEFIIMLIPAILSLFIPNTSVNNRYKYSFEKFKLASGYIFKSKKYITPVIYSGALVALSHFFFWSFQPLLKQASAPVFLFGVIVLINNIFRAFASIYTGKISKYISITTHGILGFIFYSAAFICFLTFLKNEINLIHSLIYIIFLCVCIALQLMFTIRQTSYLQHKAPDRYRGYIAGVNMMIARGLAGIALIMPKIFQDKFQLENIHFVYFICFCLISFFVLPELIKLFRKNQSNTKFGYDTILIKIFIIFLVIISFIFLKPEVNTIKAEPDTPKISVGIGSRGVGDSYLADPIVKELRKEGLKARSYIVYMAQQSECDNLDYNIVFNGQFNSGNVCNLSGKHNIFWLVYSELNINDERIESDISVDNYVKKILKEIEGYDALAVASPKLYNILKNKVNIPIYYIPQHTDPKRFYYDWDYSASSEVLFVGLAHYRRIAPILAVKNHLPISIYGDSAYLAGVKPIRDYIPNEILRKYYSSAKIVLNDTIPSMRKFGFVPNRIYDVSASGGFVISDYIKEIEDIYGDSVPMWKNEKEFVSLVNYYLAHDEERKAKAQKAKEITLKNYTSEIIAKKFIQIINDIELKN